MFRPDKKTPDDEVIGCGVGCQVIEAWYLEKLGQLYS